MGIKVIVAGFRGRMGSAAVNMVKEDEDLILSALLDPFAKDTEVDGVPVFTDKSQLIGFDADVWIDFTTPAVAYDNTRFALEHGFAPVVGTTGFTEDEIVELIALSEDKKIGGLIAPNFAIGLLHLRQSAFQDKQIKLPNISGALQAAQPHIRQYNPAILTDSPHQGLRAK